MQKRTSGYRLIHFLLFPALLYLTSGCAQSPVCGDKALDRDTLDCIRLKVGDLIREEYMFQGEYALIDMDDFYERLSELDISADKHEFLRDLQRVVASLHDGHTWLRRPSPYPLGRPPLDFRYIDGGIYIAGSSIEELKPGDRLVEISGRDAVEVVEELVSMVSASTEAARIRIAAGAVLSGPVDEPVQAVFETEEGLLTISLKRESPPAIQTKEPFSVRFKNAGYIRIQSFSFLDDAEQFDALLGELMDTEALILDLRGNGGGRSLNADLMLGRFIDRKLEKFEMIDIEGRVHVRPETKPRGEMYKGELVLLTDALSFSAANYLAHRVSYHGLGTIIGERTGGGAAALKTVRLAPDVTLAYSHRLFIGPDGRHSERGIDADIEVFLMAEDLKEGLTDEPGDVGTDIILQYALQFLGAKQ